MSNITISINLKSLCEALSVTGGISTGVGKSSLTLTASEKKPDRCKMNVTGDKLVAEVILPCKKVEGDGNIIVDPVQFSAVVGEVAKYNEYAELSAKDGGLELKADDGSTAHFALLTEAKETPESGDELAIIDIKAGQLLTALRGGGTSYKKVSSASGPCSLTQVILTTGDNATLTVESSDAHKASRVGNIILDALKVTDIAKLDDDNRFGFSFRGEHIKLLMNALSAVAEDKPVKLAVMSKAVLLQAGRLILRIPVAGLGIWSLTKAIDSMLGDTDEVSFEVKTVNILNAISFLGSTVSGKDGSQYALTMKQTKEGMLLKTADASTTLEIEDVEGALDGDIKFNLLIMKDLLSLSAKFERLTILISHKTHAIVVDASTQQGIVLCINN